MNDLNTLEKLEEYFKQVNCYGKENCCFVCSTIQSTQFGLVGAIISMKKIEKLKHKVICQMTTLCFFVQK